ncbi:MAG TPA: hypothetical protein VFB54_10885 [Burkholderiales bacterium]|nr:hypothetical protein [Burkholderiales bacterium]
MKAVESDTPALQQSTPRDEVVIASPEQIRRAEQLRARLRETWRREASAAIPAWCISAD